MSAEPLQFPQPEEPEFVEYVAVELENSFGMKTIKEIPRPTLRVIMRSCEVTGDDWHDIVRAL